MSGKLYQTLLTGIKAVVHTTVILVCSLLPFLSYAQLKSNHILSKDLHPINDTLEIDSLTNLSQHYIEINNKDSAQYYAQLSLDEAMRLKYNHGIAQALERKAAIANHFEDDFRNAEKFAWESLVWYQQTANQKGLNPLYDQLLYAISAQSRFKEAIAVFQKKYELCKSLNDTAEMLKTLGGMAASYRDAGDYEKSFYYTSQHLKNSNSPVIIQSSLFQFGELYMKIEDYPAALASFRQALQMDNPQLQQIRVDGEWDVWMNMEYAEIFSHLKQFDSAWHYFELNKPAGNDDKYIRVYLVSTGEYYFLQGIYDKALNNFLQGLQLHKKLNDCNEIQRSLIFVGKTYLALQQYNEALEYGRQALAFANTTGAKQIIRDACQILYTVFDVRKQTDSANHYFRKYSIYKDSVANDHLKAKFAFASYEHKIELLDQESERKQQQLRQSKQQKAYLIGAISVIFFIGAILFRNILLKRKNEKNSREKAEKELQVQKLEAEKAVAAFHQQTSQLEMQALRAQMNPHFIFNSLNAINRFILQNDKTGASGYLTKFSRLVRLILQNSQAGSISLEKELESLDLYLELEALRFDNHFDFIIRVDKQLDISGIRVPPLIIQPYAENAIWHGLMHKLEKGHLEIEVYTDENLLYYTITDDGIGRKRANELKSKSASTHKSLGMEITAQRIAMLGQGGNTATQIQIRDLVLPDGSAGGTQVLISIPFIDD